MFALAAQIYPFANKVFSVRVVILRIMSQGLVKAAIPQGPDTKDKQVKRGKEATDSAAGKRINFPVKGGE